MAETEHAVAQSSGDEAGKAFKTQQWNSSQGLDSVW